MALAFRHRVESKTTAVTTVDMSRDALASDFFGSRATTGASAQRLMNNPA